MQQKNKKKKEITKIEINEIYNVECEILINQMIKNEILVDAIITDPPYNVSRKNNFKTMNRNGIDFGEWDKDFNQIGWLKKINKIIKPGGNVLIFNDWKNMGDIAKELEKRGFIVKDLIRWEKSAPMPRNVKRRYVIDAEYIIWAVYKGEKWTFNKPTEVPYLRPKFSGSSLVGKKRIHPNQKSSKVITELIKIHTNEHDLIFDPFSGSGEISINSFLNNRNFIASENNKTYWRASNKRMEEFLIKPAFNHLGNKFRIINDLLKSIKTNKNNEGVPIVDFVDVFAGSAIVSTSLKNVKNYWINDNDINVFKILNFLFTSNPKTIIKKLEKIIHEYDLNNFPYKEGYNLLKKKYNDTPLEKRKIEELFVLVLFGFNQQIRFNKSGNFNIPAGKTLWTEYQKEKITKFIVFFKEKNINISNLDFEEFVEETIKKVSKEETVFYFDPPYLISNATYNNEWTLEEEKRLIKLLKKLNDEGYKWVLSNMIESKGIENEELINFINEYSSELIQKEINVKYYNSNYQRKKYFKEDREIILKNY